MGQRQHWEPLHGSAFRAGGVAGTQWDNANIGNRSTAFGISTTASGPVSTAFGDATTASGDSSTAFGIGTTASGVNATAFGTGTTASGLGSTSFGAATTASGMYSAALGYNNTVPSFGETVLGIGATTYTPSVNGTLMFRTSNATDRLFALGNAIDANNNDTVDAAERSDALIILKNGLTRLPSTTNAMITAADGKAIVTKEYLGANTSGTLDQAYDFGGAGLGKTITADAGAVTIGGTDGLVSTGTIGSGALAPAGGGVKMFWNPRKAAFRAGSVFTTNWDDVNIGDFSIALGNNPIASGDFAVAFGTSFATGDSSTAFGTFVSASGEYATAFGQNTSADGYNSTAFGFNTTASGDTATAFGIATTASGLASTAFGANNTATGSYSAAFGSFNNAVSYGETVIGIGAAGYVPSVNGATIFTPLSATDRLFVIGNAIDSDSNGTISSAERSNAMIVLKNGLTRLPSTTNAMITAADGKAVVTKEYLGANSAGTLDNSYDFGGPGSGRNITADTGAVLISGNDGLQVTGTFGSGAALDLAGAGTRMFFNPRKSAFRVGRIIGTQWNDANVGSYSSAFGYNTTALGDNSTAFGIGTTASGYISTAFGIGTTASEYISTAFGSGTTASAVLSTTFGLSTTASGDVSTAFGIGNTSASLGETVLGIGATSYTPSTNGATQFRAANATDRLFVIGNAVDANNNNSVDTAERSDAMVVLKNGNTGIGNSAPQTTLQVESGNKTTNVATAYGNLHVGTDGTQALNKGGSISLGGNTDVAGVTQQIFATIEGRKETATANDDNGYLALKTTNAANVAEHLRITSAGLVGIGTTTPQRKLHVFNGNSTATANANADVVVEDDNFATQSFLTPSTGESAVVFGTEVGSIRGGIVFEGTTEAIRFRTGGNTTRMSLLSNGNLGLGTFVPGGQLELSLDQGRKPGTNTWTIASDERLKNIHGNYSKGLSDIVKLRPITYNYINTGKRTFEESVLQTEFAGFSAQEVQRVFPEAVGTDDDGYLNFNMHSILVASINALKELDVKNKELQTQNEDLKTQLETLQQKVNLILADVEKLKK